MLQRLLIPLDASPEGARVLPYATALAKRLKQPVVLVSVIEAASALVRLDPESNQFDQVIADLNETRRASAQQYLDGLVQQLAGEGISATAEVVVGGGAGGEIVEAAKRHSAELIVMATHARSGPERWFLGSVADHVVRHASVPVLMVRPREDAAGAHPETRAIIVPLDGSEDAEQAIPYAAALGAALNVPVTLLRSQPVSWSIAGGAGDPYGGGMPAELLTSIEADAKGYLGEAAQALTEHGVETKTHFGGLNSPAAEIAELAEQTPGALIVMTSHGRSGLSRTLLGSVADKVVRSSDAPVLVIRLGE